MSAPESQRTTELRCPICGNRVPAIAPASQPKARAFVPFCSERCKLIDLHAWLGGEYQLPHLLEDEDLEELG